METKPADTAIKRAGFGGAKDYEPLKPIACDTPASADELLAEMERQLLIDVNDPKPTFRDILDGQDLGADKACEKINAGDFDFNNDPLTHIIYNSFIKNEGGTPEIDIDSAITDLNYSISMLKRAKLNYEKFQ